jgi:hypothetical protein
MKTQGTSWLLFGLALVGVFVLAHITGLLPV